jgi:hypothetical protein
MTTGIKFQANVHFRCGRNGRKLLKTGDKPRATVERGRLPRISRLMALAIHFDALIRDGAVADQAELARLGQVTRARMTQIMNLLQLAPEIQEELLFLPRIKRGKAPIQERHLRPIAAVASWRQQRGMWSDLRPDGGQ